VRAAGSLWRGAAGLDRLPVGFEAAGEVEPRAPAEVASDARNVERRLHVGDVVRARREPDRCAGDGLAGDVRDLGHRQRLPGPDIVFAGRQSLSFQRDDERFGDIVDMDIVIDELRIAGNFRDASGAGVADHRTEMAIGAYTGRIPGLYAG